MAISNSLAKWREADLFNWLSKNYYNILVNTNENYSRSDCYDIETKNRIELKCRKKHYDNVIIEKSKYDYLMNTTEKDGDIPIFIVSTPKGIFLFELKNINFEWYMKTLPNTTEFENKRKIIKEVGELNIYESKKLM